MNQKLSILMVLVAFLFSGNVFAQAKLGDAAQPYAGSTHSYWVNSSTGSAQDDAHKTNKYQWKVTEGDLASSPGTSDLVLLNSDGTASIDQSLFVQDAFTVKIKWNSKAVASGKTYYLHVIEQNSDGCTNYKVLPITPVNGLALNFDNYDVTAKGVTPSNPFATCAPDVIPVLVAGVVKYNYQTSYLYYKIVMSHIDNATSWSFDYTLANTKFPYVPQVAIGTLDASGAWTDGGITPSGSTITIPAGTNYDATAAASTIYLRVALDNNNGDRTNYASMYEGLDLQPIAIGLSNVKDGTGLTTTPNNSSREQDVKARPATSSPISHD